MAAYSLSIVGVLVLCFLSILLAVQDRQKAGPGRSPALSFPRKAMLIYMHPDLIQLVKDTAHDNDQKAWQLIDNAVARALKWKKA